jgi:hypothetical protein
MELRRLAHKQRFKRQRGCLARAETLRMFLGGDGGKASMDRDLQYTN